ncbi:MAG TPA: hypothetical protein PKI30_08850, partial [Bacillota bacterium]|nr:hypothetical protein [Bacillota bacterium]
PNRRALLLNLDEAIRFGEAARKQRLSKQGALFTEEIAPPPMPGIEDFPQQELLAQEKEYLGLYLSGHPLQRWEKLLAVYTTPIAFLAEQKEGRVTVGGMISSIKEITTKHGQRMAYVGVEDLGGSVELVVFPQVFDRCRAWLEEQRVVLACGKLEAGEEDSPSRILADELLPVDEGVIQLQLAGKREELVSLQAALREGQGTKPVIIELTGGKTRWLISTDPKWWPQEQKLAGGRWKYRVISPSG